MFDFLIDIISNNLESLASLPALFPMGRLLAPRGSNNTSSGGSSSGTTTTTTSTGMRVRRRDDEPDPVQEPTQQAAPSPSPIEPSQDDRQPRTGTFEEAFGGIGNNISPDQLENLRSIFNQDFVNQQAVADVGEESRQQVSRGINPITQEERDRVRAIANQDFVSDDITNRINNLFGPSSIGELESRFPDIGVTADEAVADIENNPLTSTEFASQFSGNDFLSQVEAYQSRLQDLQSQLIEAQRPSQAELEAREDLDQMRSSFREAQETSRNRHAPEFAIRGELAQQNRQFSIQRQGLVDDLERMRDERSTRINEISQRMQFNDQNFKLMQDLQQLQTPNTRQFKTVDGVMYAIQENPMTGEIRSVPVMNVGGDVEWQGFRQDPTTGRIIRWGVKGSGENQEIIQEEMPEDFTPGDVGMQSGNSFERRSVGNNVIEYEVDEAGRVVGQRVVSSGGSSSGGGSQVKFSQSDIQKMVGADIPTRDIPMIEQSINQVGFSETLERGEINGKPFTNSQKQAIRDAMSGSGGMFGLGQMVFGDDDDPETGSPQQVDEALEREPGFIRRTWNSITDLF